MSFENIRQGSGAWSSYLMVVVLALLPKCSLCLFALGSAISVCGLPSATTPVWEYFLIVGVSIFPIFQKRRHCSQRSRLISMALMAAGSMIIVLSLLMSGPSLAFYYAGIGAIVAGQCYVWIHPTLFGKPTVHQCGYQYTYNSVKKESI